MANVKRKTLPDGRILVVRQDGSSYIMDPMTGQKSNERGPNPDMAEAWGSNDTSTMDDTLAWLERYENSPYGQRANRLREEAWDEDKRRWDTDYGLRRDTFEDNREYRRDDLQLRREDQAARIAELERRYGLDVARFGTDYVKTGIEYAKTPRNWISSLLWERGATPIYQSIAQGKNLPAFGAKGDPNAMPAMNSIGDTMGMLGFGNAGQAFDPGKAVQQILKAVPPGQMSPAGQLSPAEVSAIQLAQDLYKAGGTNVKEGQWESMDPDEQQSLLGVMDFLAPGGGARYERQLARTRIPGQGRSNPYAA